MSAEMSRTIAGIVAFYPDPARVLRLIASIADDVSRIVLFANSPLEAAIKNGLSTAAAQTSVTLIAPGENVGLGSAYNRIVELARLEGAEFVLLFDQDSTPSEGMVRRLEHLADELKSRGEKPAVVGPRPTKANGEPFKVPRRRSSAEGLPGLAVDFAISSGSLIALRATAEVGPFNEEFFIDAIDIEWCSRAWSAGWSVWLGVDIPMTHRLGRGVIHLPLGLRLTDQPSERLYTYFRNQVAMLRLPHVPSAWKLRFIASLPARCLIYALRNGFARPAVSAIIFGLIDGIAHRLGPPRPAGNLVRFLRSFPTPTRIARFSLVAAQSRLDQKPLSYLPSSGSSLPRFLLANVTFERLAIAGLVMIVPRRFGDERGYFMETYSARDFAALGIGATFVQDNQSLSAQPGTVRGLHFQIPPEPQAKLVRVLKGSIFDVAVDLRRGSSSYGRWCSATLTAGGGEQLFIPQGFAHGFCTLETDTEVAYKVDGYYAPECDAGILWNDPALGIAWPIAQTEAILSRKDAILPRIRDFASPFRL